MGEPILRPPQVDPLASISALARTSDSGETDAWDCSPASGAASSSSSWSSDQS